MQHRSTTVNCSLTTRLPMKRSVILNNGLRPWKELRGKGTKRDQRTDVIRIKVELRDFYVQVGEYLAENEPNSLDNYYVETTAFREALVERGGIRGTKGNRKDGELFVPFLNTQARQERSSLHSSA